MNWSPWRIVLDDGVECVECDLVLPRALLKVHTGVLELVTPQDLARQVGRAHLAKFTFKIETSPFTNRLLFLELAGWQTGMCI